MPLNNFHKYLEKNSKKMHSLFFDDIECMIYYFFLTRMIIIPVIRQVTAVANSDIVG